MFGHCGGYFYYFLTNMMTLPKKNEEFYNTSIKKILVSINGMPHQLYAGGLKRRDIYPELKMVGQ